jgi:hypothetical protein
MYNSPLGEWYGNATPEHILKGTILSCEYYCYNLPPYTSVGVPEAQYLSSIRQIRG